MVLFLKEAIKKKKKKGKKEKKKKRTKQKEQLLSSLKSQVSSLNRVKLGKSDLIAYSTILHCVKTR
jgi:hypothetical protein